jgi:hypothetical protein
MARYLPLCSLLLGSATLAACATSGTNTIDESRSNGGANNPVPVTQHCPTTPSAEAKLSQIALESSARLRVKVEHGGGCAQHTYTACWDGAVLDSQPPQVELRLHHDAHGDACDAYLSRDILIDTSSLPFEIGQARLGDDGTIHLTGR